MPGLRCRRTCRTYSSYQALAMHKLVVRAIDQSRSLEVEHDLGKWTFQPLDVYAGFIGTINKRRDPAYARAINEENGRGQCGERRCQSVYLRGAAEDEQKKNIK